MPSRRFKFKGSGALLGGFLAINMFSGAVLLIPLYRLIRSLGLLNTYYAMIVPGVGLSHPDRHLVVAHLHAAHSRASSTKRPGPMAPPASTCSGGSSCRLSMPGIAVVAISTFIGAYAQQFIFALTFNAKQEFMPLAVGLYAFFGREQVVWNELMAASLVGILRCSSSSSSFSGTSSPA